MKNLKMKLQAIWNWVWSKTTIDEKVEEKIDEVKKETKRRVKRVKEELKDVRYYAKETVSQAGDIVDAAKGKKRRGRKPKSTK